MSVDTERLYAATEAHLQNLFAYGHLPAEQQVLVRRAYMHGCAIMAEAAGLDGARWVRDVLGKKPSLILPPGLRVS